MFAAKYLPALLAAVLPFGAPCLAQSGHVLPADTIINVTPTSELTSKKMKEGDDVVCQIANDVAGNGVVFLRRGSPVKAKITWKTGKAIGGKSAKFEVTFVNVNANGRTDMAIEGEVSSGGQGQYRRCAAWLDVGQRPFRNDVAGADSDSVHSRTNRRMN